MDFQIDESFLCSVPVTKRYTLLENPENPTHKDLIKILKNEHEIASFWDSDHPEFTELRMRLRDEGYIHMETGWWNGDEVLKPFKLNGVDFEVGDKFVCAAAMKFHLDFERKYKHLRNLNPR